MIRIDVIGARIAPREERAIPTSANDPTLERRTGNGCTQVRDRPAEHRAHEQRARRCRPTVPTRTTHRRRDLADAENRHPPP